MTRLSGHGYASHLKQYFPKPKENEEIPIHFLDFEAKIAGWCPKRKKTIYLNIDQNSNGLKRIRHVNLVKVYNWFANRECAIELSANEFKELELKLDELIQYGGEMLYTRRRVGRQIFNTFRVDTSSVPDKNVTKRNLVDMLD